MPSLLAAAVPRAPSARTIMLAALMGATMLAGGLAAARADTIPAPVLRMAQAAVPAAMPSAVVPAPAPAPQNPAAAGATDTKGQTVEQRIAALHAALRITPDQDVKWKAVAQAMRENDIAMEKLAAEAKATPAHAITAVADLNMYRKFAQAHVDGLKNLIDDFKILYVAMPDAQKKIADEVFKTSGS